MKEFLFVFIADNDTQALINNFNTHFSSSLHSPRNVQLTKTRSNVHNKIEKLVYVTRRFVCIPSPYGSL